jgi:hypothetical protein
VTQDSAVEIYLCGPDVETIGQICVHIEQRFSSQKVAAEMVKSLCQDLA